MQTNDATFSKFASIHVGDIYSDAQTRYVLLYFHFKVTEMHMSCMQIDAMPYLNITNDVFR